MCDAGIRLRRHCAAKALRDLADGGIGAFAVKRFQNAERIALCVFQRGSRVIRAHINRYGRIFRAHRANLRQRAGRDRNVVARKTKHQRQHQRKRRAADELPFISDAAHQQNSRSHQKDKRNTAKDQQLRRHHLALQKDHHKHGKHCHQKDRDHNARDPFLPFAHIVYSFDFDVSGKFGAPRIPRQCLIRVIISLLPVVRQRI